MYRNVLVGINGLKVKHILTVLAACTEHHSDFFQENAFVVVIKTILLNLEMYVDLFDRLLLGRLQTYGHQTWQGGG